MKVSRTSRLDSEYQKEIASIISKELKNREPQLSGIISVTEADVAPDLKTAKIFLSIYAKNEEKKAESFALIVKNAGYIRHCLSQRMRMRTVPVLTFCLDGSMEYGSKIDELLKQVAKDLGPDDEEDYDEE